MKRRRLIVTPFQACVLVLSSEPAGPYYLPIGIALRNPRVAPIRLPHWSAWNARGDLMARAPYRRRFWQTMHKTITDTTLPGTASWSIALGLS